MCTRNEEILIWISKRIKTSFTRENGARGSIKSWSKDDGGWGNGSINIYTYGGWHVTQQSRYKVSLKIIRWLLLLTYVVLTVLIVEMLQRDWDFILKTQEILMYWLVMEETHLLWGWYPMASLLLVTTHGWEQCFLLIYVDQMWFYISNRQHIL